MRRNPVKCSRAVVTALGCGRGGEGFARVLAPRGAAREVSHVVKRTFRELPPVKACNPPPPPHHNRPLVKRHDCWRRAAYARTRAASRSVQQCAPPQPSTPIPARVFLPSVGVHREDRRGLAVARDDIPATYTQINRIHIIGTLQIGIIGIQIVCLAPISCFGARELRCCLFFCLPPHGHHSFRGTVEALRRQWRGRFHDEPVLFQPPVG
jgi:hypothetical protein